VSKSSVAGRPTWYPSLDDELLLRAALQRDERGVAAWGALRPRLDLDTISHHGAKLLPLVHRSLVALGIDDPELPRMKGLHRHHWYKNQQLLQHVSPALAALSDAGIPTMALKGVPLGLTYYDDLGFRPMADLDLLVPFTRFREAVGVLDRLGFGGDPITEPALRYFHSRSSVNANGIEIDLHFLVHEALGLRGVPAAWARDFWGVDIGLDEFWSRAIPLQVAGAATTAPAAEDLLLHVLVHGAGNHSGAPLRWIADAVTIIERSGSSLDWNRVVQQASSRHVGPAIQETIAYLDDAGFATIPSATITAIRSITHTRRDRLTHRLRMDTTIRPGRLKSARWAAGRFLCATAQEPLPAACAALPAFLAWDAQRPRDVPLRMATRLGRGLRAAVSRGARRQALVVDEAVGA
jgi:hypothetical protein